MFQLGDCVTFIDIVGKGVIKEIKGNQYLVTDSDGFEDWFARQELLPCQPFPERTAPAVASVVKKLPIEKTKHPLEKQIVGFKNENGMGFVVGTKGTHLLVRNEAGFESLYEEQDLIVYDEKTQKLENIAPKDVQAILHEELKQPKRKPGVSTKGRVITAVEIDLHIHELLESTAGMTKHDLFTFQMNYAKNQIERCRKSGDKRLVLIHGKGKGRLREALWNLLQGMDKLDFYDASFAKYGGGAIEVKLW